jgi:chaperonin GroES
MATTFTPLQDRILVRRVEEAATTRGGILIPDSAKDKPQEGEVISVGKGKSNEDGKVFPLAVKAGDPILFGKYAGSDIKIDGEEFLIMKDRGGSRRTVWRHQEGNRRSAAVVVRSWSPVASSRTPCNPRHSAGVACKKIRNF